MELELCKETFMAIRSLSLCLERDKAQIGVHSRMCSNPSFFAVEDIPTSGMDLIVIVQSEDVEVGRYPTRQKF